MMIDLDGYHKISGQIKGSDTKPPGSGQVSLHSLGLMLMDQGGTKPENYVYTLLSPGIQPPFIWHTKYMKDLAPPLEYYSEEDEITELMTPSNHCKAGGEYQRPKCASAPATPAGTGSYVTLQASHPTDRRAIV